ncbi:uncharacterized protein Nmag_3377 [Natrialba magadii ATCC 43099]|uniref:Uncharacterized protein n=1 Tax=Natrialba magadii (strain ATCC 43099 / DSM 3394 / CCM 3739 / CIP 104546 / IAM 13178 / JCM 8861 / NBRC 102185 / NCIMB 2190 / MS3) TaxID=547559 RepID=D3ST60_NATMM|nr:uncharacterized protein Nmag_3377 [Natrialba magadii ATCC 43099]ELY28449.1 hypothetical protein C500_13342 [Natrialba magadii ATCC 43099]
MVSELAVSFVIGFGILLLASFLGTTLALRSFFGPDHVDPVLKNFTLDSDNREIDSDRGNR